MTNAVTTRFPDTAAQLQASIEAESGATSDRQRDWRTVHRTLLLLADVTAVSVALCIAYIARFAFTNASLSVRHVGILTIGIAVLWLGCLYVSNAYEVRRIAPAPEEWRRVVRSGALAGGIGVSLCFFLRQDIARGYLAVFFPVGIVLLAAGRLAVGRVVRSRRAVEQWHHRVLAVGSATAVRHLAHSSARSAAFGMIVVGACVDDIAPGAYVAPGVPVVGSVADAAEHIESLDADVLALAGSELDPHEIRELSWQLERTKCNVVTAPSVSEISRSRLHVIPLEGMPLLWVDQPRFTGFARRLKRMFDISAAALGLLLLSPLLTAVAICVKVTSAGPMLFRQSRLGLDGAEFTVLKFRTMVDDAEARRTELLSLNETDGALFKMVSDPRITPLGAWLRRLSIDELPQLWNVVRGQMSLVGPRPLATIDSNYDGHARRRLLVQPGITGLWQVSGRSNVTWDEAVRMDLFYVENWSLGLDLALIFKTVTAVFARRGAY